MKRGAPAAGSVRPLTNESPRRHTVAADGRPRESADAARTAVLLDRHQRQIVVRLRRIEGQARGIQEMVVTGRDHVEVVLQMRAMEEAIRSTIRAVLHGQLGLCANAPSTRIAQEMLGELIDLMRRHDP